MRKEVFVVPGCGTCDSAVQEPGEGGYGTASGVLHENDVDAQIARAICTHVVQEEAFEPVSAIHLRQAAEKNETLPFCDRFRFSMRVHEPEESGADHTGCDKRQYRVVHEDPKRAAVCFGCMQGSGFLQQYS